MMKTIKIIGCSLVVLGSAFFCDTGFELQNGIGLTSMSVEASEERAYIIEWRYKVIDGHLYKRLYNATKEEWVGDWILVQ